MLATCQVKGTVSTDSKNDTLRSPMSIVAVHFVTDFDSWSVEPQSL